jgi:hypothetical protein
MPARQLWTGLFSNLLLMTVLLGVIGVTVDFLMNAPGLIPSGIFLNTARNIYWRERDKDLIQFSPECAQHHDWLGYTLRPGTCTFSGPEFSNKFDVNSLGLRDDERSIHAPELIVIGDSEAMGWGVEQNQTFAQIVEERSGLTVLNAAISSYGTAREVMSLRRLDTSRLRFLVIQYSDNDFGENAAFYESNNHLETMSFAKYAELSRGQEKLSRYYFAKTLKYVVSSRMELIQRQISNVGGSLSRRLGIRNEEQPVSTGDAESRLNGAELFLNVLNHSAVNLKGVDILAFDISVHGRSGHRFFNLLQASLRSETHNPPSLTIQVIDTARLLDPQHYYRLDGHLNVEGHRVVAEAILQWMRRSPVSAGARPPEF